MYKILIVSLLVLPIAANVLAQRSESKNDRAALAALSLEQAIALALAQDRGQRRHKSMADAFSHKAQAVKRWPDPVLKLGLANFPTDTFERSQEPMTQIKTGVQQSFPKGKTLKLKSDQANIESSLHILLQDNQRQLTQRRVRKAWLELLYWRKAEAIVHKNKSYLYQALRITRDQYRSGRRAQQDVIRAELEIDLIKDRLIVIQTRQQQARASLGQWIGQIEAARPLQQQIPDLPVLPARGRFMSTLKMHPLFLSSQRNVAAKAKNIGIAKQDYKPAFSVEVSYGEREDRPDFASIGLGVKLPLFKKKKYDAKLRAAQSKLGAAIAQKDDVYAGLMRDYHSHYATWEKLAIRNDKYKKILLPRARSNARITVSAYRNGRSDFNTLIRARVMELDIELKALRVLIDYLQSQSDLLYLAGVSK